MADGKYQRTKHNVKHNDNNTSMFIIHSMFMVYNLVLSQAISFVYYTNKSEYRLFDSAE